MTHTKSRPCLLENKRKYTSLKLSPLVLLQKERIGNVSRPRLSGKVSTVRLTEGASMSRTNKKRFWPVYADLPLSPRKARHFPPCSGEAETKEENNRVLYLYTHLCVSLAGFFAKSHMMLFLLSSFRFCPPLKNDGRSELRFDVVLNDVLAKKKRT